MKQVASLCLTKLARSPTLCPLHYSHSAEGSLCVTYHQLVIHFLKGNDWIAVCQGEPHHSDFFSSSQTICISSSTRAKVVVDYNPRLLAGSQPWALLQSARQLNTTSSSITPTTPAIKSTPPCDVSLSFAWRISFLVAYLTMTSSRDLRA